MSLKLSLERSQPMDDGGPPDPHSAARQNTMRIKLLTPFHDFYNLHSFGVRLPETDVLIVEDLEHLHSVLFYGSDMHLVDGLHLLHSGHRND